ncbi:MAG: glycosyltransferase [Luteitalea sp.]|nr:glycosyltransferase [Luteitalea sp.]
MPFGSFSEASAHESGPLGLDRRMNVPGPVKIVYLMDCYRGPHAGTEAQLLQLLKGLDRTRFEPSLIVFRPTPFVQAADALPCPVSILGIQRLASPRTWTRLLAFARELKRSGVRLVHIFFNDASTIAPPFCRLGGARTVVGRRDMGFWYTPANLRLLRISNRFVDTVVANSEAVKTNVHQREGFPLERTVVLRNGHDPARFHAAPEPHLRERLGIGADDPIVGMVANLRPIKRHDDLVRAFALVRRRHPRAHLLLIGEGKAKGQLQSLVNDLALATSVHFLGAVADAIPFIKHLDVCALSSASEGLSNAILEYLGCGKPVVCTRVGGNPELIADGQNGFLVDTGDVATMADRIDCLLSNTVLARTMARRATEAFHEQFTSEHMITAHMDLYDRLLGTPAQLASWRPVGASG